jgi:imidazolonepropionase-like amidohydrolase
MPSWLLITDANVIDGTGAAALPRTSVLVRDMLIHRIGDARALRAAVPESDDVEVIDATGKTLMPGLIDAHCHMTYGESRAQEEQDLYTSVELRTLIAAANAGKVLRAGVTSISQPGGSYYIGVGLREGINSGLVQGPRMTAAGRYITTSNGLTDYYPTTVGNPDGGIGKLANTLPEMVTEVRRQVKNGVDFIKLADSPYGQWQAFTNDEMKELAELAHNLKRRITIHARGSAEVAAAVEAGFDWIMHGNVMTDETIAKLAASGIPLVPTLLLLANLSDWGHLCGVPANQRDGARRMLEKTADTLHRAHAAGVRMLSGTDTGFSVTPYGEWHARELELLMVYAGMSELEAIRSATKDAAVTTSLGERVGEVAEGKYADLIVVNGDPSKNIRVLVDKRNIEVVIKGGAVVQFDEERVERRWAHPQRVMTFSLDDLTYDRVYGEGPPEGHPVPLWTTEQSKDVAADLRRHELDARAVVDA